MKKLIITVGLALIAWASYGNEIWVGYVDSPPFAYMNSQNDFVVGSDVDILRGIHQEDTFKFVEYENFKSLIASFTKDGLSYGIGGASITSERNKSVIFSIPTEKNEVCYIYDSSIQNNGATMKAMAQVMQRGFILLFIALTIIAHTIWVIERFNGDDDHFSKNYFKGIGQAYYWAVVTSSTVGYGDITPKTRLGRVVTCIIIFGGIIWFGTFVSFLTSEVTRLNSNSEIYISDFKAIGTPQGSTSQDLLNRNGTIHINFDSLKSAFTKLEEGRIECVVFDKKPLEFIVGNTGKYKVSNEVIGVEYMGIICATSELKSKVDCRIIKGLE